MSLFRLDASIRVEGSHSRAIADIVEQEWRSTHPHSPVVTRHIGIDPIPATTWGTAAFAGYTPEADRTDEQREAIALATAEVDGLVEADALLFAVPLYNFGVSQHFKTWVDLVITDPRMGPGTTPATKGKPAVLVTVRGGGYGAGTPREGWDHATGWMRRILADVWEMDLRVVESELTLAETTPAMESLRDLAKDLRASAEESAREHGKNLAADASV
ncbi:NAD(P)H-dependent oxidoreductase [Umezawaea sp. Da 62-37]|uniref:FMN-dependent NADH-azoreductase n=1 Tax=Umezawaea sp. Da 62-37 TaxID=3075927 RepID=UPI0028F70E67|nr:NAD(P)H-dependent oxidoreductase [Umezawaea sp. Da 62-37]WNV83961.1 NAD(P)H-dependent oxidoreductase [Umezawaea sp. Da 62-37]